jgi:hypothetical protein
LEVFILIRDEVLKSIDSIDESCQDSESAVIEAMIADFEKYSIMMECYDGNIEQFDSVFQEGKVLDKVKKESKKDDNKLVTVLMFIPRLIKALIDIFKKKFKDADIGDKIKEAGKSLNKASTAEKEAKVKQINDEFNGKAECYIDEKTGKIKFKKDPKSIIATATYLIVLTNSTMNLYNRIEKEFDYENPSKIRSFIDDIDKLIHGNKDVTAGDIFEGGFVALGDALKHITAVTGELSLITAGIEKTAEKIRMHDMAKDAENPKLQEALKNTTELTGRMSKLNGIIAGTVGSVSMLVEFTKNIFDIGSSIKNKYDKLDTDIAEAERTYVTDEIRQKYPQREDESDEAYDDRLRLIAINDVSVSDIIKKQLSIKHNKKKDLKAQEKANKARAKEEYKRKKEEARKGGSDNDSKEDD